MAIRDWHWTNLLLLCVAAVTAVLVILVVADALEVRTTPLGPDGVLIIALVYGIPVAVLAVTWRWVSARIRMKEWVVRTIVLAAVFALSILVARSDLFGLVEVEDYVVFALAVTVILSFLYWRISKKMGL